MPLVSAIAGSSPIAGVAPRDPRDIRDLRVAGRASGKDAEDVAAGAAPAETTARSDSSESVEAPPKRLGPTQLKPAEQRIVEHLAETDRQVRAHEAAHQAAAGGLGGAATFTYKTGPDGKSYAVGGEVPIDMSPGRTPEETLARARQVRAAALAPADPSGQDLAVAAQATQMESIAREQIAAAQSVALRGKVLQAKNAPVLGARQGGETVSPTASKARPPSSDTVEPYSPGRGHAAAESGRASTRAAVQAQIDVGEQVASTLAKITSDRAASGISAAQLQRLARLAALAYRV
jgi:hypothetical protein